MDLDFAFLCYHVEVSQYPAAAAVGIDTFVTDELPFTAPGFYLLARCTARPDEVEQKKVVIRILDADARTLFERDFAITPFQMTPVLPPKLPFAAQFPSITFEAYGTYVVHLIVDSVELARIPFVVAKQLPAAS